MFSIEEDVLLSNMPKMSFVLFWVRTVLCISAQCSGAQLHKYHRGLWYVLYVRFGGSYVLLTCDPTEDVKIIFLHPCGLFCSCFSIFCSYFVDSQWVMFTEVNLWPVVGCMCDRTDGEMTPTHKFWRTVRSQQNMCQDV